MNGTAGTLYVGNSPWCATLEPHRIDWSREQKIPGKTAIPEGRYRIRLQWSRKFGCMMPFLQDVPHFTGVMIHPGNTVRDTEGCVLVGARMKGEGSGIKGEGLGMREPFVLSESRKTFNLLFARISAELDIGNDVWIEVVAPNELATNIG